MKTLEELQAERDERAKARRGRAAERERLLLELELRFEDELGGPLGEAFAIVDVPETPIVVKLGAAVLFKRFQSAKRDKVTGLPSLEDTIGFVKPCVVHPGAAELEDLFDKRAAVPVQLANVLLALYQGDTEGAEGKR